MDAGMTFTIHRDHPQPRLITLGGAKVIEREDARRALGYDAPEEPKPQPGVKKMGKDDLDVSVGIKRIREDDAGKQGAIGNDPAPPKEPQVNEEVKVGNDKDKGDDDGK